MSERSERIITARSAHEVHFLSRHERVHDARVHQ